MRNVQWVGGALLGLALAVAPAWAQGLTNLSLTTANTGAFSSGASQTVVNTPIDTSAATAAFPGQLQSQSGLTSWFHNFKILGWPTLNGSSALPAPSSFPSTHYENAKPVPFVPVNGNMPTNVAVQHISN